MKRVHLFEFTDLSWYPAVFRRMQTDYLQFVYTLGSGMKFLVPLLTRAMEQAGTHEIVDLCSGGAGPWLRLQEQLKQAGWEVRVKLTDKFPHPEMAQNWADQQGLRIEYIPSAVDAMNVPPELTGMRTLFEGFHHFKPEQARSILRDAKEKRAATGIFEASLKPPFGVPLLLLSPLSTVLGYLCMTPFMKPRTWWRFLWTYLVPLVPLATCWDGVISFLRAYSVQDLREMVEPLTGKDYTWEVGLLPTGTPVFDYTYLIGYPVEN